MVSMTAKQLSASSILPSNDTKEELLSFLRAYAAGRTEPKPAQPSALQYGEPEPQVIQNPPAYTKEDLQLFATENITNQDVDQVKHFYSRHRFLPPPRSVDFSESARTIQDYNLGSSDQKINFDRALRLVRTLLGHHQVDCSFTYCAFISFGFA